MHMRACTIVHVRVLEYVHALLTMVVRVHVSCCVLLHVPMVRTRVRTRTRVPWYRVRVLEYTCTRTGARV